MEECFGSHYLNDALIDYKIDFMNYDDEIGGWVGFHWWVDASKMKNTNKRIGQKVYRPAQIKIIKPHGSFNWRYCDCCKRIFLTHWDTNVDLNNLGFKGELLKDDEWSYCPYDNTFLKQCIMPPTHFKDFSNNIISSLFTESVIELRKAKTVCFVGYSFPEADIHIKAMLDKVDCRTKKLYALIHIVMRS